MTAPADAPVGVIVPSADAPVGAIVPSADAPVGVIIMAYGTPRSSDEIEPYYTDIRRGRPPSAEALAELTARYEAIGGLSPLAAHTEAQRDAIAAALTEQAPDRYRVAIGLKHADPKIEATVASLADEGVSRIVGIVLAPHDSAYSVGQYLERARAAAEPLGIEVAGVRSWATEPAYVSFLADDLRARLDRMAATSTNVKVVFTAHSLPSRILSTGDPYPDEVRATAGAVAAAVGLRPWSQWTVAWQSAGRTPEPWLEPDVLSVIDDLSVADAADGVIVCACGFVADHLEVLYDLDIEARARATERGLAFDRTASVNDDPAVMAALAARVVEADHRAGADRDDRP